jgi:hypothetical protein
LTAQIVCNKEISFLKVGCFASSTNIDVLGVTLFLQNWEDFNLETGVEERTWAHMH